MLSTRQKSTGLYSSVLHNFVFPASLALTRSRCYRMYREMLDLESRPRNEIDLLRWTRFKNLLEHAYTNVPYYRNVFNDAGLRPDSINEFSDLVKVPELHKRQIQKHFPDRITAENIPSTDWQYVSTRGTSNRLIAVQDFRKRDTVRAVELRAAHLSGDYRVGKVWAEIPPDVCSIVCGDENEPNEGVLKYGWQILRNRQFLEARSVSNLRGLVERKWLYRRITYPPFGADGTNIPEAYLSKYIDWLKKDRPYLLKALPTYALKISQYVTDNGIEPLPVDVVKPMGGSVSSVMRKAIHAGFAGAYREDYGSSEFGGIACDCERGDGLHVFNDVFLVEIVRDNQHCREQELGKVLVTDLNNYAMPMIRYEIGDLASISLEPCGCGRTSPRLTLEGRIEDSITADNGNIVSNDTIMDYFYSRSDTDQFQLVERSRQNFDLLLVPKGRAEVDTQQVGQALSELLGREARFNIQIVSTIPPEGSGKFRFVKRRAE